MYNSKSPQLIQAQPKEGKQRQRGWKTINGWNYEAKKLATCLIRNAKKCIVPNTRYTWHVTINIKAVLTIAEHKLLWKKATRLFRQHFTGFYIREPNQSNHVNYHIIVNSEISEALLRACIIKALAHVENIHSVARIYLPFGLCRYICKTKEHADKRVYFADNIKLNKHGSIGKFWHKSPSQIWQVVITEERQISAIINEAEPHITRAARYLHNLIVGYIPLKRIRRFLAQGYPDNTAEIQALSATWLSSLDVE